MTFTPRQWWTCSLDVEQLAWASVAAARDAANRVAVARRLPLNLETDPALIAGSFAAMEHMNVDGRTPSPWAPLSSFFPTEDGWVRLHANYPHHATTLQNALNVSTPDELTRALSTRSAADIEETVSRAGGIAAAVRSASQWRAHPHGAATAEEPWAAVERRGQRPALAAAEGALLAGVRVLDLTRVIAGPTCSQLLACLGADVLRIDPPARPELLNQHLSNGMGKRSAAIDLAADPDALTHLLATADVVLLGYRPGSLARFGLDPAELIDRHPRLVVASLSAWGEQGSWTTRAGFDSIVQAACGIADECAADDGRPGALPVQALDHSTGYLMAAHVMDLLADAHAGIVRISLLGAARTLLAYPRRSSAPAAPTAGLPLMRVQVNSPHGRISLPAPPLTVDGKLLHEPVGGYAHAAAAWV